MSKEYVNFSTLIHNQLHEKFTTTFIYALSQFELEFGHLWGEDLDEGAELSDSQDFYYKKFMEMRKRILDVGNNQKRNAINSVIQLIKEKESGNDKQ